MPQSVATDLHLNPFLHIDGDRIYNPVTDRALVPADPEFAALRAFIDRGVAGAGLEEGGWVVRDDVSRQYLLKVVSLETMTACNQKCFFCPVSIAPREDYTMPAEFFEEIVNQLTTFRSTLESVFLQSYN